MYCIGLNILAGFKIDGSVSIVGCLFFKTKKPFAYLSS